jgi:pyruvate, orthophosphate dikinase
MQRYVYAFGKGTADGNSSMKEILGGKGANLAEMARIGLPVPPGFTISTEICRDFYANNRRQVEGDVRVLGRPNPSRLKTGGMTCG